MKINKRYLALSLLLFASSALAFSDDDTLSSERLMEIYDQRMKEVKEKTAEIEKRLIVLGIKISDIAKKMSDTAEKRNQKFEKKHQLVFHQMLREEEEQFTKKMMKGLGIVCSCGATFMALHWWNSK